MNILALNGFMPSDRIDARIDQYFDPEYCVAPFKRNWRPTDAQWVADSYVDRFDRQPCVITGFSDGGTLAMEVAQQLPQCLGAMIHSGSFRRFYLRRLVIRPLPMLFLFTRGDITPTDRSMRLAARWFHRRGVPDVELQECEKTTWHGHEYANGLTAMANWFASRYNYALPLRVDD